MDEKTLNEIEARAAGRARGIIVHARDDVPALLTEVRRLRAAAKRVDLALAAVSIEAGVYAENGSGPESKPIVDEVYAALNALRST